MPASGYTDSFRLCKLSADYHTARSRPSALGTGTDGSADVDVIRGGPGPQWTWWLVEYALYLILLPVS